MWSHWFFFFETLPFDEYDMITDIANFDHAWFDVTSTAYIPDYEANKA